MSLLLILCMVITMSPVTALAEDLTDDSIREIIQTEAVSEAETESVEVMEEESRPEPEMDQGPESESGTVPEDTVKALTEESDEEAVIEPEGTEEAPAEETYESADTLPEEQVEDDYVVADGNGADVSFIRCSWDGNKVVSKTENEQNVQSVPADGSMTEGWYYLNSNVTVSKRISLTGDTNLILGDGCILDVKNIYIPKDYTLTIYAQSNGNNAGTIYAHASDGAAIGGYSGHKGGTIVIHGGNITANGASHCAGIGSNDGQDTTEPITIYGGTISAKGGGDGAGIGGGRNCDGGIITIYGGNITAKGGGENGAAIGGGDDANGGTITINGGTITANEDPNEDGAGIGGGDGKNGGNITINGGTITIWSRDGACIGGGDDGEGGTITINGGTITCNDEGSAQGARIGGGSDADGGDITITGGTIDVYSRDGAGIGGGEDGDGGTINISGGTVTTHPEGQGNAAGIGGGNHSGEGGKITITGGTVTAESKHGAGIGGGRADDPDLFENEPESGDGGTITISGGKVHATSRKAYGIGAGGSCRERGTQFSSLASETGEAGTITINRTADVTAEGYLAGIGGDEGKITISGGTVNVSGYDDDDGYGIHLLDTDGEVTISGGTVNATGVAYCAGISCERGTVKISGSETSPVTINAFAEIGAAIGTGADNGEVYAGGGRNSSDEGRSMKPQGKLIIEGKNTVVHATSLYNGLGGIGCGTMGEWIFRNGATIEVTITHSINAVDTERSFYEGARITAGSSKEDAKLLKAAERETAYAKYKYRIMEPCDHKDTTENDGSWCWACGAVLHPKYIEYSWNDGALTSEEKTADQPALFPKTDSIDGGTYYVNKNITIKDRVNLKGDTELILGDGNTLKVEGLYIPEGKTLTIYGQSEGTGTLISEPDSGAAIGGYSGHKGGDVIIHGGIIKATGHDHCAGIGSNDGQGSDTGSFTMYHGDVTATGGSNGAGIGGGRECDAGTITIYGGTVTATGKNDSAGIGGGDSDNSNHGNAGDINIYGGTVTATCSGAGAAIGGADYGTADIGIQGGMITATCSGKGKGIGGGSKKSPDESTITLDYTPGATSNDISITASTFDGVVTLEKPFKNSKGMFRAGTQVDLTKMAGNALVPCGCEDGYHDWAEATCTEPKICKICGKTEGEALGHNYEDMAGTARVATCTEPGKEADRRCSRCDEVTDGKTIPASGHDWGEWIETRRATETEEGEETRTCKNDPGHTETRTIPMAEHVHLRSHVDAKEATCTEDGNYEYWVCDQGNHPCGRYFSADDDTKEIDKESTVIHRKGHTAGEGVREKEVAATCTDNGTFEEVVYCTGCKTELRRTDYAIPAVGHTPGEAEESVITHATCTENGICDVIIRCEVCQAETDHAVTIIPALGHDWDEPEYEWADDYLSVTATHRCKRDASHTETETVPAVPTVTRDPDCTNKGQTTYTADSFNNAGFEAQEKTVTDLPALGHDWKFKEWTWTGNEEEGYTEARVHYECSREGCGLTREWTVRPEEIVIEPTCTEGGTTIYRAEVTDINAYDGINRSDIKRTKATEPLGHDYKEVAGTDKAATCAEPGKKADRKCSVCGDVIAGEIIPASGHDWSDWTETKPATETEEGEETRVCQNDLSHVETRVIPKKEHVHVIKAVDPVDATCTEAGNIGYYRCDCGRCFSDEVGNNEIDKESTVIYPKGHTAGEGVREKIKEATCTENGSYEEAIYCTECGAELSRTVHAVPAAGHKPGVTRKTDYIPATCEEDGSYTAIVKCMVCESETDRSVHIIPAKGHTWKFRRWIWTGSKTKGYSEVYAEYECTRCKKTQRIEAEMIKHDSPPTCTEGEKSLYTANVSATAALDDSYRIDSREAEFTDKPGHDWQAVEGSAAAPTCTKAGKEADQKCAHCGAELEGTYLPPTGHDWGDWEVMKPASEEDEGEEIRVCNQDPSHVQTRVIPKTGHVHVRSRVDGKDATCTETGNIEYWICDQGEDACGLYFSADDDKAKIGEEDTILYPGGHTAGEAVKENVTAATCKDGGSYDELVRCRNCGVVLRRTSYATLKKAHTPGETDKVILKEATCTEEGSYELITCCTECDSEIEHVVTFVPATGHKWDYGVVTKEATQSEEGELLYNCILCGETKTEPIPKKKVSIEGAEVILSAIAYTYNGKVRKPAIKTIDGKVLKAGTDYSLTWSNAKSKNVGSYTVTITGKGDYIGTTKAVYKINPKGATIKKPKKAKKAVTVRWKKQSARMSQSRITGYQIQLATDKKFTKNKKIVMVKGYKKTSKKVKKLKGKKKYYVRIRTYMTVSGVKYYSAWSKTKTVKTKK